MNYNLEEEAHEDGETLDLVEGFTREQFSKDGGQFAVDQEFMNQYIAKNKASAPPNNFLLANYSGENYLYLFTKTCPKGETEQEQIENMLLMACPNDSYSDVSSTIQAKPVRKEI